MPPQGDLRWGFTVRGRRGCDRQGREERAAAAQRRVRGRHDPERAVHRLQFGPGVLGIELDLVHRRGEARVEEAVQVGRREVGHPQCPHAPLGLQRRDPAHRVDVAILIRVGPVHEEQIERVDAEAFAARVEGAAGAVDAVVGPVELGGDEDLGARDPASPDPLTHSSLVPVVLSSIDVPVTEAQRGIDRCGGLRVVHGPGAERERWHAGAAGEVDRWGCCGGHGSDSFV